MLAEQKYEKRANRKSRKGKKKDDGLDPNDPKYQLKKQLKEFYAKQGYTPKYEKVDGKQVEIEYSKEYGMQNAMHLIMRHPNLWVVQFFINELNLAFDTPDYRLRTPFSLGIDYQINKCMNEMDPAVSLLIERGVKIDTFDEAGHTPYLKLYNNRACMQSAEKLREKGADVNAMSKHGIFVLKTALMRRDDAEIIRLIGCGADINKIDH